MSRMIYVLLVAIIITFIPTVYCLAMQPPVVYVSGDGTGDFNCDGKNDQVEINQAFKFLRENPGYTTVYLKGPFTYEIRDTIYIGSNVIFEGDKNAVLRLPDNLDWQPSQAMIKALNPAGEDNITIRGFEIDGNHDNNTHRPRGGPWHYMVLLDECTNVTINDMYMHDNNTDAVRILYLKKPDTTVANIKFFNNRVERSGHEALYLQNMHGVEIYNNYVITRTNSAFRLASADHAKIYNNVITAVDYSGGPGIEIQGKGSAHKFSDVEIYNNLIYETYGPGIWIFNTGAMHDKANTTGLYIHNNTFRDCGTNKTIDWVGGIVLTGFDNTRIENNIFDGCYGTAVAYRVIRAGFEPPSGMIFTTILRNNIITNTRPHVLAGNGIGVANVYRGNTFILENNVFFNNPGGSYFKTEPGKDDFTL